MYAEITKHDDNNNYYDQCASYFKGTDYIRIVSLIIDCRVHVGNGILLTSKDSICCDAGGRSTHVTFRFGNPNGDF